MVCSVGSIKIAWCTSFHELNQLIYNIHQYIRRQWVLVELQYYIYVKWDFFVHTTTEGHRTIQGHCSHYTGLVSYHCIVHRPYTTDCVE